MRSLTQAHRVIYTAADRKSRPNSVKNWLIVKILNLPLIPLNIRQLYAAGNCAMPAIDFKLVTSREVFEVSLNVRPRLSPTAYEQLVAVLNDSVGRRFPRVKIGGNFSSSM